MSIPVNELKQWLDTLEDEDEIYIDDDGLTLVSLNEPEAYVEIGGSDD